MRVVVRAEENTRDLRSPTANKELDAVRTGRGEIIFRVQSLNSRLIPYKPAVIVNGDSYRLSAQEGNGARVICNEEGSLERAVCFVTKNEIIGVKFPDSENLKNFSWKIDDKPYICDASVSDECSDQEPTDTIFFPVTGNPGKQYIVSGTAINTTTGKTVELTRTFLVIEPYIRLYPPDEGSTWRKYLGSYKTEENNTFDRFSEHVFQVDPYGTIRLAAEFHPGFIADYSRIQWRVDGALLPSAQNTSEVNFQDAYGPGGVHNITAEALYHQSDETIAAIKSIWGITPDLTVRDQFLSSTAQVEVVAGEENAQGKKRFFASFLANLPENILYILQLAVTVAIAIFLLGTFQALLGYFFVRRR